MGFRYTMYRIGHELEKRTGGLKKKHPSNPNLKTFITLNDWKLSQPKFLIVPKEELSFKKNPTPILKQKAQRILNGEVCFFNNEWKNLGLDYNWITNPENKFQYDVSKHWSEINDLDQASGDIKFVWEKSRFTFLLTLVRNDYHFDEDHSEFVFSQIESWIDANPINQGPNWKCSQEISLRIFNWMYALYFYKNSKALTEKRWEKIQHVIYWSQKHVFHHINFSRIAVRNNHAITETLFLSVSNMLFPFFPESKVWSQKGRKWFEQEVAYQIYEDGTFLQFSMNYHRVVIQLLSVGISLSEKHEKPFSNTVYDRAEKSLDFLYQCLQEENGFLPNYGNNDGALFFPLSDMHYRDYRPQLNALHQILYHTKLYDNIAISEDGYWISSNQKGKENTEKLVKKSGIISYPISGYFLIREEETFTFIRCGNHKDRPFQADNLHVDIWNNGVNVLRDSGTYKYNTEKKYLDYFTGSASHNTVMVQNHSQMLKGNRFIWFFWSQSDRAVLTETDSSYIFEGQIAAFRFLDPKATHKRTIVKYKNKKHWEIDDQVIGLQNREKFQIWHHDNNPVIFEATTEGTSVSGLKRESYNSSFYGIKEQGSATAFQFENSITTQITIV